MTGILLFTTRALVAMLKLLNAYSDIMPTHLSEVRSCFFEPLGLFTGGSLR
jgi:hypothetical protein